MTISNQDIEKIARLAYLDIEPHSSSALKEEINSIMNFVDQLRTLDTKHVAPLFHPLALHQALRTDEVTEQDCIAELEAIAPLFENDLYLVPKVIESGQ